MTARHGLVESRTDAVAWLVGYSRNLACHRVQFLAMTFNLHDASAAGEQSIKRHSGRKLRGRVAPDRGFGGWGCPGPLALTGVGDQLTGALSRTQSTHKPRVFDKNQTSLHASSHWTLPARIRDHAAASINHRIACLYFDKGCWWRELPSANASSFQQGLSNDRACAAAFPQIAAF